MDLVDDNFIKVILQSIEGGDEENDLIIINDKEFKQGVVVAGYNYSSEIIQLNVEYTNKNGVKRSQNFILKIFSSVANYELGKLVGIYDKEVEMYKSVFPAMAQLLLENQNNLIFPKIFKSLNPDILVLEDLKSSGYEVMDRIKQLDFQHSAVAFKTLGKFHALSIRLNEKSPNLMDKAKVDIFFDISSNNIKAFSDMYEKAFDSVVLELKNIEKTTDYVDSFIELKFQIFDKIKDLSANKTNEKKVLIHGDHWLSNIMFKHDEDGNVIDNKLIDFQLSRWTTLAVDIWYFVVTSIEFRVFQLHFDSFIAIYYASLNDMLEKLGSDVRYTLEDIRKEINDNIAFGVYTMLNVLPIIISDPSDPIDMSTMGNDLDNLNMEGFTKAYGSKYFLNVLVKWFLYFNERIDDVKKGLMV